MRLAVVQYQIARDRQKALEEAEEKVREAAGEGAEVILLPELFESPYFCQEECPRWFEEARTLAESAAIARLSVIAAELGVVIPVSFFERRNQAYFNSVAMIDADGGILGVYRKSHIPDGPGYEEKFYFSPGDTGFRVWQTRFGQIGVGICWDQWFPEAARAMVLGGADLLLYPTAIGSEPTEPEVDTMEHWRRVMLGHAGANIVPVAAANRIGFEQFGESSINFYGSSFISGSTGEIVESAPRQKPAILHGRIEVEENRKLRANWGFFRDRRPQHYRDLLSLTGDPE
ncbi:MAG: N-carbamoylputrescine amidase [Puniceicoccaceae bacterium]